MTEQYKVDHLFLLIGENTLPNYVAAKLLLNEGRTVYLIHTANTADEAKQLKKVLADEFKVELRSLNHYESDAYYIQKEIKTQLSNINGEKIGLNYTGGTKAMSAHSYRTLFYEEIKDNTDKVYRQRKDVIFSYLDPRRLEICIDREDNERERFKVTPDVLELKLETLFELHGLKLKSPPTQKVKLLELAEKLVNVFADKTRAEQWFDWYKEVFCAKARKENRKWQSKTDLGQLVIPVDKLSSDILEAFKQLKLLNNDEKLVLAEVKNQELFSEIVKFCEWLDGLWLEHYVLQQIKNIADSQSIQDYGLNFNLNKTKNEFEFDVAFTRGYQLFAISCTTADNRGLCKSKLFEAYLRAQQMGGEEARVALVCCSDEPDSLKAEITNTLRNKKIAVFGRDDLVNLSEKINTWINDVDRGAI
ncbi:MAG: Card1-like endonuclease domain-containing protein [Rivularia sp. (in: cyanobacteria)]